MGKGRKIDLHLLQPALYLFGLTGGEGDKKVSRACCKRNAVFIGDQKKLTKTKKSE